MGKNILIIVLVIAFIAGVAWFKTRDADSDAQDAATGLPKLVEIGAGKCAACKEMKPVIDALQQDFAHRLHVQMIDVFEESEKAADYEWRIIPCQIFLAPDGRELWRHEGFLSREDILARWNELGYPLGESESPESAPARAPVACGSVGRASSVPLATHDCRTKG
jgi:thioredoxin 1